eukprot:gene34244-44238_t
MGKPSSFNKEPGFRPTETRLSPNEKGTRSTPPLSESSTLKEFHCHKCLQKVSGSYIEAINRYYHKECFKCEGCLKLIVQLNSFIPFGTPQEPHHPECVQDIIDGSYNRQPPEVCFHCKQSLLAGVLLKKALGRSYHPKCFTCYRCKKIIDDQSFAPYGSPEQPYHPQCLQEEFNSRYMGSVQPLRPLAASSCFKCKKSLHLFSGAVVSSASLHDRKYHVSCFCCEGCQQQIAQGGCFVIKGEPPQPYHDRCATELFNPRCSICCKAMSGQYYSHMYFKDEIYCKDVAHEQRKSCCSCGRREPFPSAKEKSAKQTDSFSELPDGRMLCGVCVGSVIMDSSEAAEIFKEVVNFMETVLHMRIPEGMRSVPILAVDLQSLNENKDKACSATHGSNSSIPDSYVRGLTMSSRSEIRHISPGMIFLDAMSRRLVSSQETSVVRVEESRSVSAVLVLFGMPRDLTASVLAHEAMHVWLKLNKDVPFELQPKVEEGICQVVSYKYLDALSELDGKGRRVHGSRVASSSSGLEDSLRSYYQFQIQNDPSPVYGDGFRLAQKCEQQLGLDVVVEHISQTKNFPTV